jgi:hypothetical protein
MMKRICRLALGMALAATTIQMAAQDSHCPGQGTSHFPNLACQLPTGGRTIGPSSRVLPATFATQLNQLPVATAISGSGLLFTGIIPTVSADSLGTILTQRGETIGRHKFFASFNYQHFNFENIDGISLNKFQAVEHVAVTDLNLVSGNAIDLQVDQFTFIGSFGLTQRIDLSFVMPFSRVMLDTDSRTTATPGPPSDPFNAASNSTHTVLHGRASGIGDVTANFKANIFKSSSEHTNVAVGAEVRLPTGDELNYLGSGAVGFKPYFIISHHAKKITPNVNLGYQWNGKSVLNNDTNGVAQSLPSAFLYSGGADFAVSRKLTLVGEFLGQYVIDGPRLAPDVNNLGVAGGPEYASVKTFRGSYAMNNAGVGMKFSPIRRLSINAHVLFQLDDTGLRSRIVPLAGISYMF